MIINYTKSILPSQRRKTKLHVDFNVRCENLKLQREYWSTKNFCDSEINDILFEQFKFCVNKLNKRGPMHLK